MSVLKLTTTNTIKISESISSMYFSITSILFVRGWWIGNIERGRNTLSGTSI